MLIGALSGAVIGRLFGRLCGIGAIAGEVWWVDEKICVSEFQ